MVADTHLPLSLQVRRVLLLALTCLLVAAAMMLSASGASARTRICPHVNTPVANLTHDHMEHAAVCLAGRVRVGHHRVHLLPGRTL